MCVRCVVAGMATAHAQGTSPLSLRNGCRCVPDAGVTVEDLLLVIGQKIGFGNIISASRMNKAIVVFLKTEALVSELTVSGIWVKETFVPVTPLSAPATKVIVSNAPPFISNEAIVKELLRFGKIASPIKAVPLGCKDAALKHVLSFKRHVYMFLSSPEKTLEVSFRVSHGENSFMVYASTMSLKCYECGDLGHKRLMCPHRSEQRPSTSRDDGNDVTVVNQEMLPVNNKEKERTEEQDKEAIEGEDEQQEEVSELDENASCVEKPGCVNLPEKEVREDDDDQSDADDDDVVQKGVYEEDMADETESLSQYTDDGMRDDVVEDLYPLQQINSFLDKTKGKAGVEIRDYFPDADKFIASVMWASKKSSYDELSQQKRFRLKKYLTVVRSGKRMGKAKGKSK